MRMGRPGLSFRLGIRLIPTTAHGALQGAEDRKHSADAERLGMVRTVRIYERLCFRPSKG